MRKTCFLCIVILLGYFACFLISQNVIVVDSGNAFGEKFSNVFQEQKIEIFSLRKNGITKCKMVVYCSLKESVDKLYSELILRRKGKQNCRLYFLDLFRKNESTATVKTDVYQQDAKLNREEIASDQKNNSSQDAVVLPSFLNYFCCIDAEMLVWSLLYAYILKYGAQILLTEYRSINERINHEENFLAQLKRSFSHLKCLLTMKNGKTSERGNIGTGTRSRKSSEPENEVSLLEKYLASGTAVIITCRTHYKKPISLPTSSSSDDFERKDGQCLGELYNEDIPKLCTNSLPNVSGKFFGDVVPGKTESWLKTQSLADIHVSYKELSRDDFNAMRAKMSRAKLLKKGKRSTNNSHTSQKLPSVCEKNDDFSFSMRNVPQKSQEKPKVTNKATRWSSVQDFNQSAGKKSFSSLTDAGYERSGETQRRQCVELVRGSSSKERVLEVGESEFSCVGLAKDFWSDLKVEFHRQCYVPLVFQIAKIIAVE